EDTNLVSDDSIEDFKANAVTKSTEPVNEAFKKLVLFVLSAVAVVDETSGVLIETVSPSDLRYGYQHDPTFGFLHKTCADFVIDVHNEVSRKQQSVTAESTLGEVFEGLVQGKVHQLWIVDDDNKPIGS